MGEFWYLAAIGAALLFGAMSPGPSFLVVARIALLQSRAHGIASAVGTGVGVMLFTVIAGFGVTQLIQTAPNVFAALQVVGSVYLFYLARVVWSQANDDIDALNKAGQSQHYPVHRAFWLGLAIQLSNPKTALVIAAIFAALVPENAPQRTLIIVPVMAFIIDFSWYALVAAILTGRLARNRYLAAKPWFDRIAASILALIALRLFLAVFWR